MDMSSGTKRSSPPPKMPDERYLVTAEIGRGGCAVVYEARDVRLSRLVAMKVLHPKAAHDPAANERLEREARVAAAIHHPNVCSILDTGRVEDGRPYIVMERLYGETLRACIARLGHLPTDAVLDMTLQLLSGIDASHQLGVVHRDLKPDNVFLVHRAGCHPMVKVLDFGLCRRIREGSQDHDKHRFDDRTLTNVGNVVGTPEYMAPEQVSGTRNFDGRIDLYAVGIILWEALTGTRAFAGNDIRRVLVSVLSKPLPSLRSLRPDLPVMLEDVVSRAIERDPRLRYRSAIEMQRDLQIAREEVLRQSFEYDASDESMSRERDGEWEMPTKQIKPRLVAG